MYSCALSSLFLYDQFGDIVECGKNHQPDEQDKSRGVDGDLIFLADGFSADRLDDKEYQPSAVQRRNGQKVKNAQIDGNEREQHQQ